MVSRESQYEETFADKFSSIQFFGLSSPEHRNFQSNFYKLSLFKNNNVSLSIDQIFRDPSTVRDIVFELVTGEEEKKYVRIETASLFHNDQQRLMLKVTDVSDSVKYDESKEQNEMLSILNATISHELRNPLNSIVGQNTKKEELYLDMKILVLELANMSLDL